MKAGYGSFKKDTASTSLYKNTRWIHGCRIVVSIMDTRHLIRTMLRMIDTT